VFSKHDKVQPYTAGSGALFPTQEPLKNSAGVSHRMGSTPGPTGSNSKLEPVGHSSAFASGAQHPPDLAALLQKAFGFSSFLPNQEAVCRAAVEGRDVLLVMPTGSGKSLCYQLPAIARGGTTLVVSPLIALMEDQVAKLKARGFAVERIHSGRQRLDSRQACRDYLEGKLQFLFIAPERLRVEGFPEMLAKRPVSLIVVDEAHCISQWGHDFRPDYRRLGHHIPGLRPAPVIALTATATRPVQDDIITQLGLVKAARFIHGFRRSNIAIEVVEVQSNRFTLARELLADSARRPAIVYTPTRKDTEALANELSAYHSAAAYHAGLDAAHRKQVQEDFLAGKLEIIVATIAFGMGIDKPDVRTVIHTALPGSVEAYYQEIGRAGRDGRPSRALLMHAYSDRRTHDFFFERDYPEVAVLDEIFAALGTQPIQKQELLRRVLLMPDQIDKALEKLWTHGGAVVDYAENISRGRDDWRKPYLAQVEHRRAQIESMIRYAESNQCRMATVVRHFGDLADSAKPCGICDYCAPDDCAAQRFRPATRHERATMLRVAAELRASGGKSTGRLHTELFPGDQMRRDEFENLLGAMARAGILQMEDAVFEKNGRQIPYRTARLTPAGQDWDDAGTVKLLMKERAWEADAPERKRKRDRGGRSESGGRRTSAPAPASTSKPGHGPSGVPARKVARGASAQANAKLVEDLRAWRLEEARKQHVPPFLIFSDRALNGLATLRPLTNSDMLSVPGIGLRIAEKYGNEIRRILHGKAGETY
jgi:RecQ family ATP-dependent DNA helicase